MRTFVEAVKVALAAVLFPLLMLLIVLFFLLLLVLGSILADTVSHYGKLVHLYWQAPILRNLGRAPPSLLLPFAQLNLACQGGFGQIRLIETTSLTRRTQNLYPTGTPVGAVRESYVRQGFADIDSSRQSMSRKYSLPHHTTGTEVWVYRIAWKAADDGTITQIDGCVQYYTWD